MLANIQPDESAWFDFVKDKQRVPAADSADHEATQTAASNTCSLPQDKKGCPIRKKPLLDTPLLARLGVPTFGVREDDLALTSTKLVFKTYLNDGKMYNALMRLAVADGRQTDDNTWTIRVGYTALSKASGCSPRALGRARARLIDGGFLRSTEPHNDRQPITYIVRSIACVDAIYRDAGCTHFRIMPGGKIQPFRSAPSFGEAAK